jgi:hypothetical protein
MLDKQEIIAKVKSLHLPENSYIVYGSGPLAAAEIREANDIDLFVRPDVYLKLKKMGWKKTYKGPSDEPLTFELFEAHDNWNFCSHNPPFTELLARAKIIDGVVFASLEDVKKCKLAWGRPTDLSDVELINHYLRFDIVQNGH